MFFLFAIEPSFAREIEQGKPCSYTAAKKGRFNGMCGGYVWVSDAPQPWHITRLVEMHKVAFAQCVMRRKLHVIYEAVFEMDVDHFGHGVRVVTSSLAETSTSWSVAQCIVPGLQELELPPARGRPYHIYYLFSLMPPGEEILNLDGILQFPTADPLQLEFEEAPP